MLLTEEQAREKWCPFARVTAVHQDKRIQGVAAGNRVCLMDKIDTVTCPSASRCIASDCMAWRWLVEPADEEQQKTYRGFCGLAGKTT